MDQIFQFTRISGILFGAEIADKTMIVTVFLVGLYTVRQVIKGIAPACLVVSLIGVGVTHLVKVWISHFWLDMVAGGLFVLLAAWSWREMHEEEDGEMIPEWLKGFGPSTISFLSFGIAEMADRTQGATITLSSGEGSFWMHWFATSTGLFLANLAAILFMKTFGLRIPRKFLMYAAAVAFFAFGVYTFPNAFDQKTAAWISAILVIVAGFLYGMKIKEKLSAAEVAEEVRIQ